MASGIFNQFKYNCLAGLVDLDGSGAHDIKVALLSSSYTFNADHSYWSDVSSYEVSGTGYTAGGQSLNNKSVTKDNANDKAVFDADDVTWSNSTITARYAVLYDNTLINKDLIACFDFGEDKSSSNGDFTIQWSANGILDIS